MVKIWNQRKNLSSTPRRKFLPGCGLIGLIAVGAVGLGLATCGEHLSRHSYTIRVTDKAVKRYGSGEDAKDKYLISGRLPDNSVRVFENTDSPLEWKFNSSDVQAEFEVGKTYRVDTYGWRLPFFSSYENIVGVSEVKEDAEENK